MISNIKLKPHIFHIITYFLLLLFFFLAVLFYRQPFLVMLFTFLLIIPIFCITASHFAVKQLLIKLVPVTLKVTSGCDIKVNLIIKNNSPFPVFFKHTLLFFNIYYEKQPPVNITSSVAPKASVSIPLEFSTSKAGMVCVKLIKSSIDDYLKFIEFYTEKEIVLNIPVIPPKKEVNLPDYSLSGEGLEEAYESLGRGFSVYEMTGIRQYIPGDRLLHIHWKLSAKNEELMVKEFSAMAEKKLILFPMLSQDTLQSVLSTYYSIGLMLNAIGESFILKYYTPSLDDAVELNVNSEEELINSLLQLYYTPIPKLPFDIKDIPEYILSGCSVIFAENDSVSYAEF